MNVSLRCFDGGFASTGYCGVDDIGTNLTTTTGTTVSAGNGTKGAYSQLTAATARDYAGFYVALDSTTAAHTDHFNVDVAIGPSGSEFVILPDCAFHAGLLPVVWGPFMVGAPAGTRIAARAAALSGAASTAGITVHGIIR